MKPEFKWLEWEDFPKIECDIIEHGYIPKIYDRITIWRDDNYRIIFEMKGIIPNGARREDAFKEQKLRKGETVNLESIIQVKPNDDNPYSKINIEGLLIRETIVIGINHIKATGEIFKLKLYYEYDELSEEGDKFEIGDDKSEPNPENAKKKNEEFNNIVFWYLNANEAMEFLITRSVEYTDKLEIDYSGVFKDTITPHTHHELSRKYQILNILGNEFLFGYVKPEVTNNFPGTFLRFSKYFIPDEEQLNILQYSLSFILGVELIQIGYTKYDSNYSPIEKLLVNTFSDDIKNICNKIPMPPIPIQTDALTSLRFRNGIHINIIEEINFIINKFFEYNKLFPLVQMVQYINSSRLQILDIKIQPLSTALNLFQTAWFKSEKSLSKGKYLEDNEYGEIIKKYIDQIEKDLGGKSTTKAILGKIKNSNAIGFNQKYPVMFDEMKLPVGKVEDKALLERNIGVHGSLKPKDYKRLGLLTDSFCALIHRVILKLFDYNKLYIDYSAFGYPLKEVDVLLGGPKNDGNPPT